MTRGQAIPFGKYRLIERIGRGGMAEAWQATMVGPGGFERTMVVKLILPDLLEDERSVALFSREARLSALLHHAGIVQVFEFGVIDGRHYLAMEHLRGRNLAALTRTWRDRPPPSPGCGVYVAREVCRALAYAHRLCDAAGRPLGIVHRDVTPSNVMLCSDGAVKLLDFGIAKVLSESGPRTATGVLKGKLGYLAPEQLAGAPVDGRTDLFAAGIVLHETLSGQRLFRGATDVETLELVRRGEVAPPSSLNPSVPDALDRICLRALARRPEDRFPDGDCMADELDELLYQLRWGRADLVRLIDDRLAATPVAPTEEAPPTETQAPSSPLAPRASSTIRRSAVVLAALAVVLIFALAATWKKEITTHRSRDAIGTEPLREPVDLRIAPAPPDLLAPPSLPVQRSIAPAPRPGRVRKRSLEPGDLVPYR